MREAAPGKCWPNNAYATTIKQITGNAQPISSTRCLEHQHDQQSTPTTLSAERKFAGTLHEELEPRTAIDRDRSRIPMLPSSQGRPGKGRARGERDGISV